MSDFIGCMDHHRFPRTSYDRCRKLLSCPSHTLHSCENGWLAHASQTENHQPFSGIYEHPSGEFYLAAILHCISNWGPYPAPHTDCFNADDTDPDIARIGWIIHNHSTAGIQQLSGEFACVVWWKTKQALELVTDHLGSVQLYYAKHDSSIVFASNMGLLVEFFPDSIPLDENTLAHYLTGATPPPDQTLYKTFRRVPGGTVLRLSKEGKCSHRYWPPHHGSSRGTLSDESEHYGEVRKELLGAVASRTRTAPCGLYFSGGLDSSAIAGCYRVLPVSSPLHCFMKVPPTPIPSGYTDIHYARLLVDNSPELLLRTTCEEPLPSYAFYRDYFEFTCNLPSLPLFPSGAGLRKLVRQSGVHTVLSGVGGDECVSHLGSTIPYLLFRQGNPIASLKLVWHHSRIMEQSFLKEMYSHLIRRMLPEWADGLVRHLRGKTDWKRSRFSILNAHLGRQHSQLTALGNSLEPADTASTPGDHMLSLLKHGSLQTHLECLRSLDKQYQIQSRFPLLDRQLVEACLRCPPELYFRNGWKRNLLRSSLKGIVPESLRRRRDWSPFAHSFVSQVRMNTNFLDQILFDTTSLTLWNYLNREEVLAMYKSILNRPENDSHLQLSAYQLYLVAALLCFGLWRRESGHGKQFLSQ